MSTSTTNEQIKAVDADVIEHPKPLTFAERAEYEHKIARLKQRQDSWFKAGRILIEIAERNLYREQYPDFYTFCRKEFGKNKGDVNRTIECTEVAERLSQFVARPACEYHVRMLVRLDPVAQVLAYQKALDQAKRQGKPLTASLVWSAAEEIRKAQQDLKEPAPPIRLKSEVITRITRGVARRLEELSCEQLDAFETASLTISADWWREELPESPEE